jgi:hypothetical protein
METMNERQRQEAIIDAALDAYPLAPLPAGFGRATMARLVRPVRFRLTFLDVALPFGVALLMAALFGLFLWLRGTIALTGLTLPNFEVVPAVAMGGVSWAAVVFLILLGEVACLLAGLIFFTGGDGAA